MIKKIKKKILNKLLKHLFNAVTEEDILIFDTSSRKGKIGNEILSNDDIEQLRADVKNIEDTRLWKLKQKQLKYLANKMMYFDSSSDMDMLFGKAMLYNLNEEMKLFNKIKRLR